MTDNKPQPDPADTNPANDSLKNRTMRISLDDARPVKSPADTTDSKKSTGIVSGIVTRPGPIPQTIRLKRPPTSPITVQPATAETVKRQTSRVGPIQDFKRATGPITGIPSHAGPIPQTIRLKRPPTSPLLRAPTAPFKPPKFDEPPVSAEERPEGKTAYSEAPTIVKRSDAGQPPTSQIDLTGITEAVTPPGKQPTSRIPPLPSAEPPAPKTIRLKRPSSLSDAEEIVQDRTDEATLQTFKKLETSKINLPAEDGAGMPMTQRKTIKIKRTDRAAAQAPAVVAQPVPGIIMEALEPEEDTVAVPLVAFAAMLCIAALVYIMVAQAFHVNLALPASMQLQATGP